MQQLSVPSSVPEFKRQRANDDPFGGAGFYVRPEDANRAGANDVIGSQKTGSSDGVNDDVDVKLCIVPSLLPKGNRWTDNIPSGSLVFVRSKFGRLSLERTRKKKDKTFYDKIPYLFKDIDRVECATIEQLNAIMHMEALDNTRADFYTRTLRHIFKSWVCAGVMISSRVQDSRQKERLTSERVVNIRPVTDGKVINVWGDSVAGDVNSHLFLVLQEADIDANTQYGCTIDSENASALWLKNTVNDLEQAAADAQEALDKWSNRKSHKKGEMSNDDYYAKMLTKFTKVPFVPRIVARFAKDKYLPYEDRCYTVTTVNGNKLKKCGLVIYIGKCLVNEAFSTNIARRSAPGSILDMAESYKLPKIDVLVNVKDHNLN